MKITDYIYPNEPERLAYDQLPCGVVLTNDKQQITFVNNHLTGLLGYSENELPGDRRFQELLSIGGKLYFETHFAPTMALDGEIRETNFEMVDKTGSRHPVVVNVNRASPPRGGFIYVVFPIKDRRAYEQAMKRARLKAEAADKAKAIFISSMSHEIRTPLHAILEAGNFLLKDDPRPDQLEFIQVLRVAGSSLLDIVNDILDISKLESGMTTLDERPVHADQLVKQVVDTYGPICRGKGVELKSDLPLDEVPLLLADGGKLIQVLNNLLSNAVKFTSSGAINIALSYEKKDELHELTFTIRDTGPGIAEDQLERIFKPFMQASETTHTDYGGTGLGLAICKKILAAYGSDLKVKSKVGQGTEFYFTLMLKAASEAQRRSGQLPGSPAQELPPLNHLRVLNVDDNRANLLINSRYFSEWKLNFDQARSGREALDLLDKNVYDVVLLDLRMPDMNGYELARRIRSHPNTVVNQLPLIALSASTSTEVSAEMLEAGINDLVLKPFHSAHLHHTIRRYGEHFTPPGSERQDPPPGGIVAKVDFSKVKELFAGDEPEFFRFLRIIHEDVVEAKQVLETCTTTFSRKDFDDLQHNLISTMREFLLADLARTFEEGKVALEADNRIVFLTSVKQLLNGLEVFRKALRKVLDKENSEN